MPATVYVVDDDEAVRSWAEEVAGEMGCLTRGYASAEAFLSDIPTDRPSCLVLDLVLKGMSGVELLEKLQRQGRHFSAIAYSGRVKVADAVRFMESGALTLLQKPCTVSELSTAIQRALVADAQRLAIDKEIQVLRGQYSSLSDRLREVLAHILEGKANKAIARTLDVSERTIENDRSKLYKAFGVESVAELAVKCTKFEMLSTSATPVARLSSMAASPLTTRK